MFKHLNKILILIINFLLFSLVTLFIKSKDQEDKQEVSAEVVPITEGVLKSQDEIAADRENKLRDLNNLPKETRTTTTTTTSTTKTTSPSSTTTKSTKKTKTS